MRSRVFGLRSMVPLVALVVVAAIAGSQAQQKTVWDGVYTAAQAERGMKRYDEACSACHGADLMGGPGIPGVAGLEFMFKYNNKPVADVFDYVKMNMPPGQQGSLNDQQYVDLVAVILKANEFPEGAAELTPAPEALKAIRITRAKP